jgi:hypothetical protein
MSEAVIRRAEIADALTLAVLRRRFKVEEGRVEVPQDEREFSAGFADWLRSRIAGPWRVWLAYRRCGFDGPGELLELPVAPARIPLAGHGADLRRSADA